VDEEHDSSYKQHDLIPKYNARDSAIMLAHFSDCPVVLGSATPSIESMYNAEIGKYQLLELKERVDNAVMPEIKLVNVSIEAKRKRMENIFSHELLFKIKERLERKEGIIILQNRRGFATQIYCEDCGEIIMCNECSVPMVHHLKSNVLKCHYCGVTREVPKQCPNCGSRALKFFGTGTERVEDELLYHFPEVRIERVDSDVITKKGKLGEILNKFRNREIDILVGTQMVSKGLDFSHVTLVGVISAETTLWLPDFRADERTFQLLTQVAGRSGRSKTKGEVVIQTRNHTHFVLQKVLQNDYKGFYERELKLRRLNDYPPFARLGLIETKSKEEKHARGAIVDLYKFLIEQKKPLKISSPHEAVIFKLKGEYRYQILVKSDRKKDPGGKYLREAFIEALAKFNSSSRHTNVKIITDIDPQSVM
jgi:primosomal protein N' (replication factor Y)